MSSNEASSSKSPMTSMAQHDQTPPSNQPQSQHRQGAPVAHRHGGSQPPRSIATVPNPLDPPSLPSPSQPFSASDSTVENQIHLSPLLPLESIPTLPDYAVVTPPVQQQESILSAIAQSVAAAAAISDDDEEEEDDEGCQEGPDIMSAALVDKAPLQERGNGWALLSQSRASGSGTSSSTGDKNTSHARSRNASPTSRGRSTVPRSLPNPEAPLSSSSLSLINPSGSGAKGNGRGFTEQGGDTDEPSFPSSQYHHRHSPLASSSPAPVDCDPSSRKGLDGTSDFEFTDMRGARTLSVSSRTSSGRSTSNTAGPPTRIGGGGMELPAEGAGLRGKDENQLVSDEGDGGEAGQHAEAQYGQAGASSSALRVQSSDATTGTRSNRDDAVTNSNPLNPPAARKLCIRHQRMADEGTVGKLQRSIEALPLADQTAVNAVWSIFSSSSHTRRALILQGILSMCCFSQLSLLSSELALAIRIDPFSLFPREVSLKVMGHLDAMSLGRAAQVSRTWKALADDDLLWRNMCEQHIERKCEKCGWGLPLLSEKRRRQKGPAPLAGTPESRQLTYSLTDGQSKTNATDVKGSPATSTSVNINGDSGEASGGTGSLKRSITAAANAAALERHSKNGGTAHNSRASSPSELDGKSARADSLAPPKKRQCNEKSRDASTEPSSSRGSANGNAVASIPIPAVAPTTRPWKSVYCERLAIERNWRKGRYTIRTLKGHTDGIMCLQFNESLAHPSFPIVITGSYDRTARIWNMDTGEELRVLRGHTRGVRCLQFDEAKLITGSMDRTLKIWNWRTGALVRTLEGHTEGIVCLNFNDYLLASGSADSNIKIWNFKTGQCHTLRGHTDWVNAVTLWSGTKKKSVDCDGAEDTFLFSASDDGTIRLWDLGHNECLMVFTGHVGQCQGLSLVHMPEEVVETLAKGGNVGPNGANIDATSGSGRSGGSNESSYFVPPDDVQYQHGGGSGVGNVNGPEATINAAGQSCGYNPSAVPGGRSANTGTAPAIPDHFYYQAASGQHRTQLRQMQGPGQNLAGGSTSYRPNVRRVRKIEPHLAVLQERLEAAGLVDALPIDAEMGDLEWGAAKRAVQRSNVATSSAVPSGSGGTSSSQHTSTAPSTMTAANGTGTGTVSSGATGSNTSASASANANAGSNTTSNTSSGGGGGGGGHQNLRPMLFSCSLDNTIKIWDVRTGLCIRTLFGHMAGLWALSTDRLRLATASHDATLKIWELATGKHLFSICEHRGPVTCVQIGDDKVISGSDDGAVNVYSFATTGAAGAVGAAGTPAQASSSQQG